MLIKSALRVHLSVSYGMISILRIGSLRSPPPIRLRRTSPASGGRINRSMLSCRDMAPWLSTHSAPSKRGWQRNWIHRGAPRPANPVTCFPSGKVVAPATKGGLHFLARRAVVRFFLLPQGSIYTGAHKGAHHNPRAKGASNLSPLRTFGPAGRQPSSPIGACPYGACHIASAST